MKTTYDGMYHSTRFYDTHNVLRSLTKRNGMWIAEWRDAAGFLQSMKFLWYSKKEVIRLLRNKYNVTVSRSFC